MYLNRNIFWHTAMAFVGAMALAACGGKESGEGGGGGGGTTPATTETTVVTVAPDRETMYRNPFSGWVIYSGLGDGLSDNFWQEYDNMNSAVGKVKVSDYANALLIRSYWSQAEPEEGLYFWDEACQTLGLKQSTPLRVQIDQHNPIEILKAHL